MQRFLDHHDENILGVLTRFDRIVFRGTLRNLSYVDGMRQFLGYHGIRYTAFGDFVQRMSDRHRSHARQYAKEHDGYSNWSERTRIPGPPHGPCRNGL